MNPFWKCLIVFPLISYNLDAYHSRCVANERSVLMWNVPLRVVHPGCDTGTKSCEGLDPSSHSKLQGKTLKLKLWKATIKLVWLAAKVAFLHLSSDLLNYTLLRSTMASLLWLEANEMPVLRNALDWLMRLLWESQKTMQLFLSRTKSGVLSQLCSNIVLLILFFNFDLIFLTSGPWIFFFLPE